MSKQTFIRLSGTDVILQDYEDGKGKIILSNDDYDYNLSYYWGSIGQGYDLSKFIQETDDGYLIGKLGNRSSDGLINIKKTMASVRKHIKSETCWRFYMNLEADKELRQALNNVQKFSGCQNEFVHMMHNLDVDFPKDSNYHEYESDFKDMIQSISSEPWYFIVNNEPRVNIWLKNFLPKLRKHLKESEEIKP
ncbi:hypothetical protein [Sphingobacterium hungaricum]|uniref:Uncharacterized protein n=1 Tax=Sphingobacterium hungaricum TaxID=2082723 RepID=A0A928UWC2_9SPHI|nr:hypothetical protein [Sphingobacterium hungaricum]MBE8712505.1 hypothetical protein [Sphingobacterium hungaricum]